MHKRFDSDVNFGVGLERAASPYIQSKFYLTLYCPRGLPWTSKIV